MAMSEHDWTRMDSKFKDVDDKVTAVHTRLDPVCEQVARNTTHISWLKWAVGIVVGALTLAGVSVVLGG